MTGVNGISIVTNWYAVSVIIELQSPALELPSAHQCSHCMVQQYDVPIESSRTKLTEKLTVLPNRRESNGKSNTMVRTFTPVTTVAVIVSSALNFNSQVCLYSLFVCCCCVTCVLMKQHILTHILPYTCHAYNTNVRQYFNVSSYSLKCTIQKRKYCYILKILLGEKSYRFIVPPNPMIITNFGARIASLSNK